MPSRLFYVAPTIAACALHPNEHFCVPLFRSRSSDKNSAKAKAARRAERILAMKKRVKQALKSQKRAINAAWGKKPRKGSKAHRCEVAARLKRQPAPVSDEHIVVNVKCGSCNAVNCSDLTCALNDFQINYTGNTSGTVTTVQRAKDVLISAATVVTTLAKLGYKITKTFVINTVIATLHSSYSVVEPTITTWLHYREFYAVDTSKTHARLGQGTVILPEHVERFKLEHEARRAVGQRSLRADVIHMYKNNFGINVSYDFAGRFFDTIGFTYGPLTAMYTNHPRSPRRLQQLLNYILIMNHATKMENEGKCIIIETDESWAAQNLAHRYGYRDKDDPFTNIPVYHANKMVIIVFKAKEGVLAYVHKKTLDDGTDDFYLQHWDGDFAGVSVDNAAANPTFVCKSDAKKKPTAIHLFMHKRSSKDHGADYHVTGHRVMETLVKALVPAVKKFYPKKQVFIKWDGAGTHEGGIDGEGKSILSMTKPELIDFCEKMMSERVENEGGKRGASAKARTGGVMYQLPIVIKGKTTTVDMAKSNHLILCKSATKKDTGIPTVPELRAAVIAWLRKHRPGALLNPFQRWGYDVRDQLGQPIIFISSVPRYPWLCNIENVFKDVKHLLRDEYDADVTVTENMRRERILRAFVKAGWARADNTTACPPCEVSVNGIRHCNQRAVDETVFADGSSYKGEAMGSLILKEHHRPIVDGWIKSNFQTYYMDLVDASRLPLRPGEPEPDIPEPEELVDKILLNDVEDAEEPLES